MVCPFAFSLCNLPFHVLKELSICNTCIKKHMFIIIMCVARVSASFGRLRDRMWKRRGLSFETELHVYHTIVLPSLLYKSQYGLLPLLAKSAADPACKMARTHSKHIGGIEPMWQNVPVSPYVEVCANGFQCIHTCHTLTLHKTFCLVWY